MNSNSVIRIRLILAFIACILLVILIRLSSIQIFQGASYREKAERQYIKGDASTFNRGSIFLTSKDSLRIAGATIKEGYTLAINPRLIQDIESVYTVLSQYVHLDHDVFVSKAGKKDDPYEELLRRVDKEQGESLIELGIPGIVITKEIWRVYPGDALASQTIGILGLNGEELAGRYGLESYYEAVLGRSSGTTKVNFFAELFSDIKKGGLQGVIKEGDIVTSLEPSVESFFEKTLGTTQKRWDSDSIGGVIMDPHTGEIIALASLPTFDPNDVKNVKDVRIFSNPLVENSYEMGSIIKPLTMAAGLDAGVITPRSTYVDEGTLTLSGRKISNFDGKARGVTSMQDILSQSLNVGVAYISLKLGKDDFKEYFLKLGLGEKTGIDQPHEQKGIVKNLISGRDVEIATASYGQGIALTPIQTVRALATLANGGYMITPHIVKEIEYVDGTVSPLQFASSTQVFTKETTDEVTAMLVHVVDTALKKGQIKMENYSIAAKTGTAQIADPHNGGYYSDRYLHSFFGYFPAYNPRFIVFLYHVYPKGAQYASETLTDPFIELAKFLINYYEIPPDR